MQRSSPDDIATAMQQLPCGLFVLTAHAEGRRGAVPVRWVQQCSDSPPMVMVALAKGQIVEPLIRESRCFALCQLRADDRFLLRKFGGSQCKSDDPLVTLVTCDAPTGSPVLERAMTYLDCEVARHIELDSDHRIYVGLVRSGAVLNRGEPAVCFGANGTHRPGDAQRQV